MPTNKLAVLGLGSRSTLYYLSELNRLYNKEKSDYSTCPFILLNADFYTINSLLPYTSNELDKAVELYTNEIENFNAEHLLIPNITLHETVDRLKINKNVLHPMSLSINKIKENEWDKVILFGSYFSMNASYIKDQFRSNGIQISLPTEEDMRFIDNVRIQIYNDAETPELIQKYHLLINTYSKNYPVIIACTELSILKPKRNKNVLDMADIQIKQAIKYILE